MKAKKNVAIVLSIIVVCCLCVVISLNIGYANESLKDANTIRLNNVTAMEMDGTIVQASSEAKVVGADSISSKARATNTMQIVNFNTKGAKTTNYTEYLTGEKGYTCGAYGADAAYLGTENGKVKFMLGGVVGLVDSSEVEVLSLSQVESWSYYKVSNGRLYHYICTDMTTPGTASTLNNGTAPSYLKAGTEYYSYDGHYFYTNYNTMLKDYQNNVRTNSVNPNNPFYNYYQYLPLRSKTTYGTSQLNSIISANTSSSSVMRNIGSYLTTAQNTYGVNAIITASVAANESAWGQSNISKTKNNLFGLNAVDSSPGTSANTYGSVQACINDFANGWMSRGYLDPDDWRYYGAFLGDKASGINVKYASDPYWGEKAASIARILDADGGSIDENRYTIGIKDPIATDHYQYNLRQNANTSSAVPYQTGTASNYSFIILDKTAENGFYKVQSDGVLNASRSDVVSDKGEYDFDSMYLYMYANYVNIANTNMQNYYRLDTGDRTLIKGTSIGFLAMTSNKDETLPTVKSSDETVADVKLVDPDDSRGYYFEVYTKAVGKTTITVNYKGIERSFIVAVADTTYELDTNGRTFKVGEGIGFLALITNKGNVEPSVTVIDESVAEAKLVDSNDPRGYYFEVIGKGAGKTEVIVDYLGIKRSFNITVNPIECKLDSNNRNVEAGDRIGFLLLTDSKGNIEPIAESKNPQVATVELVDEKDSRGYYFEVTGKTVGETDIVVNYMNLKSTVHITVTGKEFNLDTGDRSVDAGKGIGFMALITDKSGSTPQVISSDTSTSHFIRYKCSDSKTRKC